MVFGRDQDAAQKKKSKRGARVNTKGRSKKQRRNARSDRSRSPSMGSNLSKEASTDDDDDAAGTSTTIEAPSIKRVNEELEQEGLKALTEKEVRAAIKVTYLVEFRRPPKEVWSDRDGGIVGTIHRRLGIDRRTIVTQLERIENGEGIERKPGSGRPYKLDKDNKGLRCAAIAMNAGMGPGMATDLCNAVNREDNPSMSDDEFKKKVQVVTNTLLSNLKFHTDVIVEAVQRDKTGGYDKDSFWAWLRKRFSSQTLFQIELGIKVDNGKMTYGDCIRLHKVPPVFLDALAQWDESNTKTKMSGGSSSTLNKVQYRIAINKNGALDKNGAMPEKKVQKIAKKTSSAAGMYGVAVPIIDGEKRPQFLPTKNYCHKTVCNPEVWDFEVQKKINQFKGIKSKTSPWYPYKDAANPWEARYGNEINPDTGRKMWEDEIRKAPQLNKLV
jgi:transposase